MSIISLSHQDDFTILEINNPPINAFSYQLRAELFQAFETIESRANSQLVLIHCRGKTFCAGADMKEFNDPPKEPILYKLLQKIAISKKIYMAALHGSVLGGGLELALACDYRTALKTTKFGFPEVKLGLMPGAGGTIRLPRLIGLKAASEMICFGNIIDSETAYNLRLVDHLFDDDLFKNSQELAKKIILTSNKFPSQPRQNLTKEKNETDLETLEQKIIKKSRGQQAPVTAFKQILSAIDLDIKTALDQEYNHFLNLKNSPQSGAMRHMFFAERESWKIPGMGKPKDLIPIKKIGIIGAGTMGASIATAMAQSGFQAILFDISSAALDKGMKRIEKIFQTNLAKGRINKTQVEQAQSLVLPATNYQDLHDCDLIIEAVVENMAIKQKVFQTLDETVKPSAILATNTSYLDIHQIAAATNRPDQVLGLHFFSPAHIMKLVELIRGKQTDTKILASALKFIKQINKQGVVAGNCYGFIGNSMLQAYMREAGLMLLEGAMPEQIDQALVNFGMPMGVFAMLDMAGLDIGSANRKNMSPEQFEADAFVVIEQLVEMGRFGQKTGKGIYLYEEGSRKPIIDPFVSDLIIRMRKTHQRPQIKFTPKIIQQRCIYGLIHEGFHILEEKMAYRSGDIDVVYVNGYGFPRTKGGPMYYAQSIGYSNILKTIQSYQEQFGPKWWTPAPYLIDLAKQS